MDSSNSASSFSDNNKGADPSINKEEVVPRERVPLDIRLSFTSKNNATTKPNKAKPPPLNLAIQRQQQQPSSGVPPMVLSGNNGSAFGQRVLNSPGTPMSSFGQRLQQRRPKGLKLSLASASAASDALQDDGLQPPPTAAGGNWDSNVNKKLPLLGGIQQHSKDSTWSVPQTPISSNMPGGGSGANQQKYHQNRFVSVIGARRGEIGLEEDGMSPLDLSGSIHSLRHDLTSISATPLAAIVINGGPAKQQQQQQQQQQQPVEGLHFMSSKELAERLELKEPGLIIDMRKPNEYTKSRISTAINMSAPTTLIKRRTFSIERLSDMLLISNEQKILFTNWKDCPWVVLYGEGTLDEICSEETSLVILVRKFMNEAPDSCKIYVLEGGFNCFTSNQRLSCELGYGRDDIKPGLNSGSNLKAAEHPLLRTMRQPPGGNGFNPSEIVPMRLPPDFATKGNQMDKLPDYLRRTADPKSGPQLLYRLFKCIDASETKRMTSMIHNNGMVTDDNQFTISAGLELGSKNRYNNIFPFDNNRVRLRSIRRAQTSIDPTMATTTTSTAAAAAIPTFIGQRRASDKSAMGSTAAAMEVSLGSLSKKKLGERPQSLGIAAINKLPHLADDQQLHMKRSSQRIVSKTENMLPPIDDNEESDFHDSSTEATARHNDYVNASYISYFDGPLYIATQGPLPDTVYDFWKMVWEHHSLVIVMLTQEHENGRSKCHHYWPNKLGEESQYGDLVVKWEAEAEHPDDSSVVARRFMLSRPTITDETVHITHLQYIGWSDHGVPENPLGVLRLRQLARKAQEDGEKANRKAKSRIPMVVHCSAGCGRTGAFCAIDTILSMQERQSTSDGKSTKTNVDCDGDTIMSTGIQGPSNMQMLPGGATHSAYDEFTGLVPQALRSQSSGDSLKSNGGIVLATPNRKSLKEWSELPPEEFHEDLVFMIVSRFRELRVTMVQTNRQFVFCHEALAWHALGNGPRSIDRIIDPRLVFEWNKANYPDLKEEDCKDLTFLLRGWHEMVKAMTESAERINNSNKGENGSVTIGRASIDVSSVGKLLHANRLSISPEIALKRSNTIGVAKRGFFGSLFKSLTSGSGGSSDDMDIDQSEEKSGKSIDVHIKDTGDSSGQQQQHSLQTAAMPATAVPPQTPMVGSFFADRPSAPMPPQTPMVGSFFANPLPSSSSSAALPPAPLPKTPMVGSFFANPPQKELPAIPTDNPLVANMGFRNRQRRPPNLTLSISNENQSQDMWSKPRVKGVETPGPRSGMGSGSTQGSGYYEPGSSVYTPLPPPLRTTAITEAHQKANDYFGISTCSNSPGAGAEGVSASPHLSATNNDAVSIASQQESVGLLDLFVNPPSSTAADWRRSVLGRLDLGNINFDALSPDAQQQRRSFAQDAAGSPYSYQGHRHEEFHTPLPQPPATATVPARPQSPDDDNSDPQQQRPTQTASAPGSPTTQHGFAGSPRLTSQLSPKVK